LRADIDRFTAAPHLVQPDRDPLRRHRHGSPSIAVERFLGLTMTAGPRYVESVVNDESQLVSVTHLTAGTTNAALLPAVNGTVGGDISGLSQAQLNSISNSRFRVAVGGGTPITAQFETWAAGTVSTLSQLRARVETAIRAAAAAGNAVLAGASVQLNGNQWCTRGAPPAATLSAPGRHHQRRRACRHHRLALLQLAGGSSAETCSSTSSGSAPAPPPPLR
jgi:hypothetical protein